MSERNPVVKDYSMKIVGLSRMIVSVIISEECRVLPADPPAAGNKAAGSYRDDAGDGDDG